MVNYYLANLTATVISWRRRI